MRKLAWAIVLLTLLLSLGCKSLSKKASVQLTPAPVPLAAPEDLSGGDRTALLSQYPLDVLPLYKCIQVTSCGFETMKTAHSFLLGNNVYTLTYTTQSSQEEAMAFYNKIVIPTDEVSYDGSLAGNANGHPADITISRNSADAPFEVTIQVGLSEQQKVELNPYFQEYSGGVPALGEKNTLYSQRFRLFYSENKLCREYSTSYVSTLTTKQFTDLYQKEYGKETGFKKTEDRYNKTVSFTKDNATWKVSLTKSTGGDDNIYLTIVCELI